MLFLSCDHPDLIAHANPKGVDGLELRLDKFPTLHLPILQTLLQTSPLPLLFTLRSQAHGGNFQGSEKEREALIEQCLGLKPPYFDLEYDMRPEFLNSVIKNHPHTKFILSSHHFEMIEPPLDEIYRAMEKYSPFGYKIASMVPSSSSALNLLLLAKQKENLSAICMGEQGVFARVCRQVMQPGIDYAYQEKPTAPGQLSYSDLLDIYRYPSLNKETKLYGLIGDPVDGSIGHLYHNEVFHNKNYNAVYVKIPVKKEELSIFLPLAHKIGFLGLSVTMPLKEAILPFVDSLDEHAQKIGAVNTLSFQQGKLLGTNTDGLGACDAISQVTPLDGKTVVVLGAGGSARAISYEIERQGATVWIVHRDLEKAKKLGYLYSNKIPSFCDILINCTPVCPVDPSEIPENIVAMDLVYHPEMTLFLQAAKEKGCHLVFGKEMFVAQAKRQTTFWNII